MEQTLVMIKPNGTRRHLIGQIISRFEFSHLNVVNVKMKTFTKEEAHEFYKEHQGKPFFDSLISFITQGSIVVLVLEADNAIANVRAIIGDTDPAEATPGTLRYDLADSKTENLVHASDSPISAKREIDFHFSN